MIKLKVSYENEKEFADFLKDIRYMVSRVKVSSEQKGQYKRAYIDLRTKGEKC